jgi:hypothetical protein
MAPEGSPGGANHSSLRFVWLTTGGSWTKANQAARPQPHTFPKKIKRPHPQPGNGAPFS